MTTYKNLQFFDGVNDLFQSGDIQVSGEVFDSVSEGEEKDCSGLFAIPGLIDAHVHLCLNSEIRDPNDQTKASNEQILDEIRERTARMVRAGITTARDLGGGAYLELQVRDEIALGKTPGPRLLCSGQPITSVNGHCHFWGGEAKDTEAALSVLERQHQHDVDLIKVMITGGNITPGSTPKDSQFDDETICTVVKRAGELDYHVAAHCHGTDGIRQAAKAGVTTVEHCSWVGEEGWGRSYDPEIALAMAQHGVWVSPTINSGWQRFKQPAFVDMVQGNYKKMKAAGVRLIASTDAGIPNVRHDDLPKALPVFAHFAGMNAFEAMRSATADCAEAIGLGDSVGRIAPGYSADFVLYDSNPAEDLEVLQNPVMVVARGVEFNP